MFAVTNNIRKFPFILESVQTNSEHQERKKWEGQNWPRVKMGYCCSPPERVELTLNSNKETNGRLKMDQESKWGNAEDRQLLFTP